MTKSGQSIVSVSFYSHLRTCRLSASGRPHDTEKDEVNRRKYMVELVAAYAILMLGAPGMVKVWVCRTSWRVTHPQRCLTYNF
jgi:hypothetical protein